jgi:hypothetical protein
MSNGAEMVSEMASEASDWSVSFPPLNWNGIRTTKVVNSVLGNSTQQNDYTLISIGTLFGRCYEKDFVYYCLICKLSSEWHTELVPRKIVSHSIISIFSDSATVHLKQ